MRNLTKARKLCAVARYPATYVAMLEHVPEPLLQRLTAAEIAEVVDALYHCANRAKDLRDRRLEASGFLTWN